MPRQHTRTHGRLSLDNLRRVKAHFLVRPGGPAHGARRVEVWSTGQTLRGWADDLRAAQCAAQLLLSALNRTSSGFAAFEEVRRIFDCQDIVVVAPESAAGTLKISIRFRVPGH